MDPTEIEPTRVVVTDLDVSFWHLVGLLLKLAFAVIPAAVVLSVVGAVFYLVLGGTVP